MFPSPVLFGPIFSAAAIVCSVALEVVGNCQKPPIGQGREIMCNCKQFLMERLRGQGEKGKGKRRGGEKKGG